VPPSRQEEELMPQPPATPGVYVNEIASQNKPIEGVGTSVAAFVGLAPWGPVNTPTRITDWTSFARTFGVPHSKQTPNGPFMDGAYLAHAVYGFFENGGGVCWVVRVGPGAYGTVPQQALPSASDPDTVALRVLATAAALQDGQEVSIVLTDETDSSKKAAGSKAGESKEPGTSKDPSTSDAWKPNPTFKLEVTAGDQKEEYTGLTLTHGPKYLLTTINTQSELVEVVAGGSGGETPIVPAAATYTLAVPDAADEPQPPAEVIVGDPSLRTGLGGLALTDEITMVCIPDLMSLAKGTEEIRSVQTALADLCTGERRMAILDPPQSLGAQEIAEWQQSEQTPATAFATLYWPWIRVLNPIDGHLVEVPPCGHVAGLWARTDDARGVAKAPANEVVMGAVELATDIGDRDQEPLNRNGVNCIRGFPGRGIRTWGARTLATDSDPEWRYVNVRRLFNYLTASIARGTSWAVFEPNDEMLWGQLRIAVTNFLTGVWRDGGLFGASPDEAFYVKCDAETNPPDLIEAGQVNIRVGVAPVEPAEFVVFQISQQQPAA
jgi:phage tail sheath protein FI